MCPVSAELCPECGWPRRDVAPDASVHALEAIARGFGDTVGAVMGDPAAEALLWRRPGDDTWSVAEYLAHTADAMEHIVRRVGLHISLDDPELPRFGDPMVHDYSDADVVGALTRIQAACADLADVFRSATAQDWERTGHNALGETSLLDSAAYAVHEAGHHLYDVTRLAVGPTPI
jgi:hypothetical protein